uniref:RNA-directed DNA polymerase n=1 Tax=Schistosoma curassoni TaxID=6186 RepID=A0A183JM54_9TREM
MKNITTYILTLNKLLLGIHVAVPFCNLSLKDDKHHAIQLQDKVKDHRWQVPIGLHQKPIHPILMRTNSKKDLQEQSI